MSFGRDTNRQLDYRDSDEIGPPITIFSSFSSTSFFFTSDVESFTLRTANKVLDPSWFRIEFSVKISSHTELTEHCLQLAFKARNKKKQFSVERTQNNETCMYIKFG